MNTQAQKVEIIQWIAGLEDKLTLRQIRKLKEQSDLKQQDWVHSISQQERESILRGLEDSANGRIVSHADVRKKYEKWL
jgi:hypothetical protein